jgi:tetratricopeptide (TPR) repeat protein
LGRFREAAACEPETTQLAEQTRHPFTIGLAHHAATSLYVAKGDWPKAHSRLERWRAQVQTADIRFSIPQAVRYSALVSVQLGEQSEAINWLREGEELLEQQVARGNLGEVAFACHVLGRVCLLLGRIEGAQRLASRAMDASAFRPTMAPQALWLLADIASHPDCFDPEHAETYYGKAMAAAEVQGRRPVIAHCHLGLGKLYQRTGKGEEAREHLTTATTMYREMDMRFWLEQAEAELHNLA